MDAYNILYLEPLVLDMLDDNEAKLCLKNSQEEYEDFLARVISTATVASYWQVRTAISRFLMRKNVAKYIPVPTFDWYEEAQKATRL